MAEIFRKNALDTMATPEQLDKQVKIVRPATWIIAIILLTGLMTFLVWSFTYNISNGINMQGVIFTNNNINQIKASRDCVMTDVLVSEGEHVQIGDIIAVVSYDEMLNKIDEKQAELALLKKGTDQYTSCEAKIQTMVDEYIAKTIIKSNTSGYIQSVESCGNAVKSGGSIASILLDSGYHEVIAYVPMQTAQNLNVGCTAQISPSYAPREEYGYMTGSITEVSATPVTEESILAKMGTLSYVEKILPDTACVEVHIKLNLDSNSPNQYQWSNEKGKYLSVELGTQCSIIAVTGEYHPIELLL